MKPDPDDSIARIWAVVAEVPAGRVANYGQIARVAGLGRRARLVGHALNSAPEELDLPWHRIINAQGRISFPPDSESYRRQRDLLEAEGVEFKRNRIDMNTYRWRPQHEDLPEEYLEPDHTAYESRQDTDC